MLTKFVIAGLFKDWKKLFKTKMKDEDWDINTINIWHIVLNDLQITADEFLLAQRKSFALNWIPTAPADFLALARNDIQSQLPSSHQAYIDAANDKYSHPVCYETAKRVGFYELRHLAQNVTLKLWHKTYEDVCKEYSQDSAKFAQNQSKLAFKNKSDAGVLASPKISLERQSEIAQSALAKIKEIL